MLLSNCASVRGNIMPGLVDRYVAIAIFKSPVACFSRLCPQCMHWLVTLSIDALVDVTIVPIGARILIQRRVKGDAIYLLPNMLTCVSRFNGLLAADNGMQEVLSLAEECSEDIKQVELRLASTYTEAKQAC